jgi:hypothetical protein
MAMNIKVVPVLEGDSIYLDVYVNGLIVDETSKVSLVSIVEGFVESLPERADLLAAYETFHEALDIIDEELEDSEEEA